MCHLLLSPVMHPLISKHLKWHSMEISARTCVPKLRESSEVTLPLPDNFFFNLFIFFAALAWLFSGASGKNDCVVPSTHAAKRVVPPQTFFFNNFANVCSFVLLHSHQLREDNKPLVCKKKTTTKH